MGKRDKPVNLPPTQAQSQELADALDASWEEHHREKPEDYPAIRNMEAKKAKKGKKE